MNHPPVHLGGWRGRGGGRMGPVQPRVKPVGGGAEAGARQRRPNRPPNRWHTGRLWSGRAGLPVHGAGRAPRPARAPASHRRPSAAAAPPVAPGSPKLKSPPGRWPRAPLPPPASGCRARGAPRPHRLCDSCYKEDGLLDGGSCGRAGSPSQAPPVSTGGGGPRGGGLKPERGGGVLGRQRPGLYAYGRVGRGRAPLSGRAARGGAVVPGPRRRAAPGARFLRSGVARLRARPRVRCAKVRAARSSAVRACAQHLKRCLTVSPSETRGFIVFSRNGHDSPCSSFSTTPDQQPLAQSGSPSSWAYTWGG